MSSSQPLPDPDSRRDYAAEQAKLGTHYYQLRTGDRAANLGQAIACFTEALRFRTRKPPLDYARTQNNLGNAYAALPGPDWPANLQRAIACYTEALQFGTAEAAPGEYARTQHNLGTPTPGCRPGTGRPTCGRLLLVTPRRCGSSAPRTPRPTTPLPSTPWAMPTGPGPPETGRPTWTGP